MLKQIIFFVMPLIIVDGLHAQDIKLKGIIKNASGKPLPETVIQIKSTGKSVNSDSLGRFSIDVESGNLIAISHVGFNDTSFIITKDETFDIVLSESVKSLGNVTVRSSADPVVSGVQNTTATNKATENALNTFAESQKLAGPMQLTHYATLSMTADPTTGTHIGQVVNTWNQKNLGTWYNGSGIPAFTHKEATKGSQYLFDNWVKGIVVTSQNELINDNTCLYNYDKISGALLFTHDMQSMTTVDKGTVKYFALYDADGKPSEYIFAPEISKTKFSKLLAEGKKYNIYKVTNTKFVKSDYHTDGMVTTGNNYDEFVDESEYYLVDVNSYEVKKFDLKKKSIKQVFSTNATKVDEYLSNHREDPFDDNFVKALGTYMNNN